MTIIDRIKQANNILIVGHVRPDGDCLGSGLALLRVCDNHKKSARFVCDSYLPMHYDFMEGFDRINSDVREDYDLMFVVDCGDIARMGSYRKYLPEITSINIDHHPTNHGFGTVNYVQKDASSTCQILFELLEPAGEIDSVIAGSLFVGLSTDTGHFMHNTTNQRLFEIAAKLAFYGANPHEIASKIYRSRSIEKTNLIVRAIQSLRFFQDNRICAVTIFLKDLEECGCTFADTEGLIDYAMNIRDVEVALCLSEQKKNLYKVSFRSKGLNVSAAAAVFGGGGHIRAAGCVLSGAYEDVIRKLVKAVTDGMNE